MFRLQTYLYRSAHLLKSCWQLFSNEAATKTSFDSLKIKNQNQTAGALSYLKILKGLSVLMC
jgi:hypothetical protein